MQALREAGDELGGIGGAEGFPEFLLGGGGAADAEVFGGGAVEEETFLGDGGDVGAEVVAGNFAERGAVDHERAEGELVEADE